MDRCCRYQTLRFSRLSIILSPLTRRLFPKISPQMCYLREMERDLLHLALKSISGDWKNEDLIVK
jgi:hypothetical protein